MALPKCVCGEDKIICIDCIEAEVERLREALQDARQIFKDNEMHISWQICNDALEGGGPDG